MIGKLKKFVRSYLGNYMEPVQHRKLFLSVMAMGGHQQNNWTLSEMELFAT